MSLGMYRESRGEATNHGQHNIATGADNVPRGRRTRPHRTTDNPTEAALRVRAGGDMVARTVDWMILDRTAQRRADTVPAGPEVRP